MSRNKVTVTIRKSGSEPPRKPQKPDEVYWGPFSRLDDDDPTKGRPKILLYDSSARLQLGALNSLFGYEFVPGIMAYMTAFGHMTPANPVQLASVPSSDVNDQWRQWVEEAMFKTEDLGYRQAQKAWGIPASFAAILKAKIKLSSKTFDLGESSAWQADKTPQERLDATPDTPENAELRAALQEEIDESELPAEHICEPDIDQEKFRWYVHDVQDIRPLFTTQGLFTSQVGADLKSLQFESLYHFEPFKLTGGSDYHVVRLPETEVIPTYAEALLLNTAIPKVEGNRPVRLWLVPRTWRVKFNYKKIYGTRGTGGGSGTYGPPIDTEVEFLCPAITNPLVLQGAISIDFLALPAPVISKMYTHTEEPLDKDGLDFDSTKAFFYRLGGYFRFIDGDDDTDLWGRYAATAEVTVEDTPEGRLVASLATKDDPTHRYLVYRKSVLEVPEDDKEVYSGRFDDPMYQSSELVDSPYNNNQLHLNGFTVFDPDNAPLNFFGPFPSFETEEACPVGWPYYMEIQEALSVHEGLPDS
jgi:hypothetical protein